MAKVINPFNKDFLAACHARDDTYAKLADIKVIESQPGDARFKVPDIRPVPWAPKGTMYFTPKPRPNETDEEWGARCVKIENIGDPVE